MRALSPRNYILRIPAGRTKMALNCVRLSSSAIGMLTVIETPFFSKLWPGYWTETERAVFAVYLSENPNAGDVIEGSGGC